MTQMRVVIVYFTAVGARWCVTLASQQGELAFNVPVFSCQHSTFLSFHVSSSTRVLA